MVVKLQSFQKTEGTQLQNPRLSPIIECAQFCLTLPVEQLGPGRRICTVA